MKIYNKKGLVFGILWAAMGSLLLIHALIMLEPERIRQIKDLIVSVLLLAIGITSVVRAYSKKASREDFIEKSDERNGTELGKTAKGYIDQGQLIPDELMIDILASVFDSFKDSKGVIFDGFPRTIAQAEALKKMLAERGQDVSVMVDLDVPEEELMVRLIKRGKDSGRADDNEETIKKRLHVYHSQTAPLIDWYKNEKKYQHINGLGTMEGIFAEICEAIDKL